ncbi:MAG: hypothetical protein WC356_02350 [Candidatus Micrarchaeia archaeon]|jgi:hypothetical protein
MPLKPGKSKKVVSENISEFHGGKTFEHTKAKFGKEAADKQAVAVALNEQRKSGGGGKPSGMTVLPSEKIKHLK